MLQPLIAEIVRNPIVSHLVIASAILAVLIPALWRMGVSAYAWHAAAYCSLYFYARESAQAERALKPVMGDPNAYFWTLWPPNWSQGGNVWEWVAPAALAVLVAAVLPRRPGR